MSDDRSNRIGWFLAGLSLGTLSALLYAPRSGRETRDAISGKMDDGRQYLNSLGRDAQVQINEWVASGKKIVNDRKRQVNAAIDAGREALREDGTAEQKP